MMYNKIHGLVLLLVAWLWWISLGDVDLRSMQDWGLLSVLPISMALAYALLILGFCSLFYRNSESRILSMSYYLLLILMIHGTPQILYGTLRYSWAWKHVGITDYIIRRGAIDPSIAVLPVYHNWPGFFALNAWFTELAGFSSAKAYAGWSPVFFEALFAFGLLALFRIFTEDHRLRHLAVWIFLLTNWIAQDYFSPQATAYFIMLGLLLLVLHGSGMKKIRLPVGLKNLFRTLQRKLHPGSPTMDGLAEIELRIEPGAISEEPASRRVFYILVVLVSGVLVSIHQLTPFIGVAYFGALSLFRIIRWRTIPLWLILLISLWLAFPARSYNNEVVGSTMESFGKIDQTVNSNLVDVSQVSKGQVIVSWSARGLSAFLVVLAGIGFFRRIRNQRLDLPVLLLGSAPIIVLFLNSYGGESLFRVYFFMLPYLSFLAAGAFFPNEDTDSGWKRPTLVAGLSSILLLSFLFVYYGKERQYSFTQDEVQVAEYLYTHARPGSLLVEGSSNYPAMFINYEYFSYVAIDREPSIEKLLKNPSDVLYKWLSNTSKYQESYLIITRSQKIYTEDMGVLPPGALERIQNALEGSDRFEIVFSNQDAIIFRVKSAAK